MKNIEVVAAVLVQDGKVLATQRGYGEFKDWWEFPGGKIETGESHEQALKRELLEELDIHISVLRPLKTVEWDYPEFHLTLHCYICRPGEGHLHLIEHEDARWLGKEDLRSVKWLPADISILDELTGCDILI